MIIENARVYRFEELSDSAQEYVINLEKDEILRMYTEGIDCYEDMALGEKIEKAIIKAEEMQTPWFAGEYILASCEPEITELAEHYAKIGSYSVSNIRCIPYI